MCEIVGNLMVVYMETVTYYMNLNKFVFRYKAIAGRNSSTNINALGNQYCVTIYASKLDTVKKTMGECCPVMSSTSRFFKGDVCFAGIYKSCTILIVQFHSGREKFIFYYNNNIFVFWCTSFSIYSRV